jgi:hypothetical protein
MLDGKVKYSDNRASSILNKPTERGVKAVKRYARLTSIY